MHLFIHYYDLIPLGVGVGVGVVDLGVGVGFANVVTPLPLTSDIDILSYYWGPHSTV